MADYRQLANHGAKRVATVAVALRYTAALFAGGAGAGAVAGGAGLILMGAPLMLGLLVGLALGLPIIGLWRLRAGLALVAALPDRVRNLPTSIEIAQADLGQLVAGLRRLRGNPRTPWAFVNTLRATVRAYERINGLNPSHLASAGLALNPAALLAGALSAVWAAATLILGGAILALALLFR